MEYCRGGIFPALNICNAPTIGALVGGGALDAPCARKGATKAPLVRGAVAA